MNFKSLQNKNIIWLSFCFAIFFFGVNGASQFFVVYYDQLGLKNVALMAMVVIYTAMMISSLIAPFIIGRFGLKRSMIISGLSYLFFIFGVISKNPSILYVTAILTGFFATLLVIARGTYLLKCAEDDKSFSYGEAIGAQDSIRAIGSTLGIIIIGFASQFLNFDKLLIFLGFMILLSVVLFSKLKPLKKEARLIPLRRINQVLSKKSFWLIVPIFFATNFMLGITRSTIPLILSNYGFGIIGLIISIFSFGPILFSISLGKISDLKGGGHRKTVLLTALAGGIIASIILLISEQLIFIALATLLVTILFSAGVSAGGGLIGEIFPEQEWETAQGLASTFGTLGVITPFLSEQFLPREQTIYIIILSCIVAFVSLLFLKRTKSKHENH